MASAPDAQALTGVCTPARAPSSRLTAAAGPFGISIGTVSGNTRRAPFSFSTSYCVSRVHTPPMPEATTTPSRSPAPSGEPASRPAPPAARGGGRAPRREGTPPPEPRGRRHPEPLPARRGGAGIGPGLASGDEGVLGRRVEPA